MAGSKFAYVRKFELPDPLLPDTFMVFRLDGHSFHRFSDKHNFDKPNDLRALQLMDHAARDVMEEYSDIVLGFGESDEFRVSFHATDWVLYRCFAIDRSSETAAIIHLYSDVITFLLRKSTELYNRRQAKIVSTLTSLFTSSYVFNWPRYFPDNPLQYPPSFDGRIILYPGEQQIRDYFSWRQADTHINNLYNTVFWALVQQGGETTTQAHATLRGTVSKEKHEILFSRFQVNYNQVDERYRKGSVLVRDEIAEPVESAVIPTSEAADDAVSEPSPMKGKKAKPKREAKSKTRIVVLHCDIIKNDFWDARPGILNG
ncbi:hypothetical protein D9615_005768 [Tricholomella constricta]|uniref:tRNA(His) guanylyltransferase n=1 Tax=Tricholomella constricta TaxID=117010 RepID=A0A8H5HAQ4_9AGAR|nr:hypothetical protein D9615_005768 [Tricholomella constricta]